MLVDVSNWGFQYLCITFALFYASQAKVTKLCFHCGGGLHLWKDADDVWKEHDRWFPSVFLYAMYGDGNVGQKMHLVARVRFCSFMLIK
jgi:hypothetical protein